MKRTGIRRKKPLMARAALAPGNDLLALQNSMLGAP